MYLLILEPTILFAFSSFGEGEEKKAGQREREREGMCVCVSKRERYIWDVVAPAKICLCIPWFQPFFCHSNQSFGEIEGEGNGKM